MKRKRTFSLLLAGTLFAMLPAHGQTNTGKGLSIWFDQPTTLSRLTPWYGGNPDQWKGGKKPISAGDSPVNADPEWEAATLPIGNGSIGANIFGSIAAERITFNEKSLWRGGPNTSRGAKAYWDVNKQSASVLKNIRQAFAEGNDEKAAELTRKNFNSEVPYESNAEQPFRFGNFTTMGEFYVETGLSEVGMSRYKRALSLDSALAVVQFTKDNVTYERKYFISYPDNVMTIRFSANHPGQQNLTFSYAPNPVSTGTMKADGTDGLVYTAFLDNNHMNYVIRIRAVSAGGTVQYQGGKLTVKGANSVVFYITADTDYKMNFNPDFNDPKTYVGVNPTETTRTWLDNACRKGYTRLLEDHYKDYATLYNRVHLSLNPGSKDYSNLPTYRRLQNYRKGVIDNGLEELYYQFGRYLLIASSRPGNLPANLQGLWHNNVDGPWRVDYHNNINIQMNYWPSCATNLGECTLPLIDFIRTLVKPGAVTAKSYFGARGWTASISGNPFGFTTPLESEDMSWNFNPMAGPWLATHVWDYYDYTRDWRFLKDTGYPLIKSSAEFAVDYLWHKPDGTYTAAPSTSPEHGPIDQGTTFVHAVVREILLDAIAAAKELNVDGKEQKQWQKVLSRLAPYKIGRYGQLMEWSKDIDDPNDHHRHVNHLFGLHPGHTISPITTPALAKASRIVLEHRGDGATGWSMGWKLNQWARLQDGNHAYVLYGNLLKNGTTDNLWDVHPPFQIDGNFGGTSGVTEMLLQSQSGFIQLLPALPDAWREGSVSGLCARGNFVIDIDWQEGRLKEARVLSKAGVPCTIRYGAQVLTFKTSKGKQYKIHIPGGKLVKE